MQFAIFMSQQDSIWLFVAQVTHNSGNSSCYKQKKLFKKEADWNTSAGFHGHWQIE